jgi:GxxExxY protein
MPNASALDYFYEREKLYQIYYKGILLPHSFYADFIIFDAVILEIKSKSALASADIAQTLNYLRCSGCKVGLILNFGKPTLEIRRVVL